MCVRYIGGDIMMHVGEQGDESLSIYNENPDVLVTHIIQGGNNRLQKLDLVN